MSSPGTRTTTAHLIILIPVFDDWPVLARLVAQLDPVLAAEGLSAEVLAVDDGSTIPPAKDLFEGACHRSLSAITVLRLGRNMGHQRGIAVGLAYVNDHRPGCDVVVMDADGEDAPADVPRLVRAAAADGARVVFAERARRSEGPLFRASYRAFQLMHRLFTGHWLALGNFSYVPAALIPRLVMLSELWSHYPAAVIKAKLPIVKLPIDRAPRLGGRSHMRLVSLVLHGLAAISVHGDVIGVRALLATLAAAAVAALGIVTVVGIRVATDLAIPGWASFVVGVLATILLQSVSLSLLFVFMILNSRNLLSAIPRRDYAEYVVGEERLHPIAPPVARA